MSDPNPYPSAAAISRSLWGTGLNMGPNVVLGDLEAGMCGYYDHATETVHINRALNMRERRCTLVHELIHWEQGHEPVDNLAEHTAREVNVEREAARRLISFPALVWAWTRHMDARRSAEGLDVDMQVLFSRILAMTPAEQVIFDVCATRCIGVRTETALTAGDAPELLNDPNKWDERIFDAVEDDPGSLVAAGIGGMLVGSAEGCDLSGRHQAA